MPTLAPPALHKPKSKLRLRLGLTPPHPKPAQPETSKTNITTATKVDASKGKPKSPERVVSTKQPLQAQSTAQQNKPTPSPSSYLQITSTESSPLSSLDSSFRSTSLTSRADSRSAFTYDSSPSTDSHSGHTATSRTAAFDTISYASASPSSAIHARHSESSADTVQSPSGSGLPTPYKGDWKPQYESEHDFRSHYPNIAAAVVASDDIFYITDQQLSDRFNFIREIGFGNWGSVWICKPKHARASVLAGGVYGEKEALLIRRLGKAAYASGGTGAGGRVALKLVHREKSAVSRASWV